MELQSALRVFNYDDFRESKLEVSRAILGEKTFLSGQTTSELHLESRSLQLDLAGSPVYASRTIT